MKQISLLIKPASSMCNMKCAYCFYHDISTHRTTPSYGVMLEDTMKKLIDVSFSAIQEDGTIVYAFQGGEPTLASISFFENFIQYVEEKRTSQCIQYVLQTNGLCLDETWIVFFKKHDFLIGVSLDGYEENHNYFRKQIDGTNSVHNVLHSIALLKQHQVRYNILCVLTKRLALHPKETYEFFRKHTLTHVQFIPCLNNLTGSQVEALTAHHFYEFYVAYFALWYQDAIHGIYQSVSLFDNLIRMIQDEAPYQCGMLGFCSPQFVVEADGSLYPCDFYAMDEYECGNVMRDSLQDILSNPVLHTFLHEKKKSFSHCANCHVQNLCHGGCKRSNTTFLEENYCGYQALLYDILPYLKVLIKK